MEKLAFEVMADQWKLVRVFRLGKVLQHQRRQLLTPKGVRKESSCYGNIFDSIAISSSAQNNSFQQPWTNLRSALGGESSDSQ